MESCGKRERTSACMAMATRLAAVNRPYRIIDPDMSSRTTVEQLVMPSWRWSSKSRSENLIGVGSDEADFESDVATERRSDEGEESARSFPSSLRRLVASSLFDPGSPFLCSAFRSV